MRGFLTRRRNCVSRRVAMTEAITNIFATVLDRVQAASQALIRSGVLPAAADLSRVVVEPPRDASHGDMATNAAMVLAKDAGRKPRELADVILHKVAALGRIASGSHKRVSEFADRVLVRVR